MARAISSLPVPVSPQMSTVESVGATVSDLMQHALQRRRLADDLLEVVLGADLVLEIDLLRRELVLELGDLLERERVLDRERHLLRRPRRAAPRPRSVNGSPPSRPIAERAEPAVVHRQRHAAHRLDALGEQQARDLGRMRLEVRALEAHRACPP